jgi:hypothetical protein
METFFHVRVALLIFEKIVNYSFLLIHPKGLRTLDAGVDAASREMDRDQPRNPVSPPSDPQQPNDQPR